MAPARSRKREVEFLVAVQRWLDTQRATRWVEREIQTRWRVLGDERRELREVLRNLADDRAASLGKLLEFDRWNPVDRQGRRRLVLAVLLLDFVHILHRDAAALVDEKLSSSTASPPTPSSIVGDLTAAMAETVELVLPAELRTALVARCVLARRAAGRVAPAAPDADARQSMPLSGRAAELVDSLSALVPEDPLWDQLDDLIDSLQSLGRLALVERAKRASEMRRAEAANEIKMAIDKVWTAHARAAGWLALAPLTVPDHVDPPESESIRATVRSLADDLEAFAAVWESQAQSELQERELFARRSTLADAVRERHHSVAAALAAANAALAPFVEKAEENEASPPDGDAVAVSPVSVFEETGPRVVGAVALVPNAPEAERAPGDVAEAEGDAGTPLATEALAAPAITSVEATLGTHQPSALPLAAAAEPALATDEPVPPSAVASMEEPAETAPTVTASAPTDSESSPPLASPEPAVPDDKGASEDRDAFWTLLARGDESGAYILARRLEQNSGEPPIAPEIIAALQASRWRDGDMLVFGGDIAELVRRTTVDSDERTVLLAAAAALVPVLVAPEANLRAWLDARVPPALASLASVVTRFADRAQQRLDRIWIDGVVDAGEQRRRAESLRVQAQRLLTEAPHRRTKYQAGTVLWQQYFRLELKPVLERIAAGDDAVVGQAEQLARRIASAAALTEELNRLDRKLRPGIGDEIDYGAREQLNSHVREVVAAIEAWAQQIRILMRCQEGAWMATQVAELRNGVAGAIDDARRYSTELMLSGSTEWQACGAALGTTMEHLAAVLRLPGGQAVARALPELDSLAVRCDSLERGLARRWLWCAAVAGEEGRVTPARLADVLLHRPTTAETCAAWIRLHRFDEAAALSSHIDDDTRQALASSLEKARLALEFQRDQLCIAVEQGVLDGYIGEERARMLDILEAIDPRTTDDVAGAERLLEGVRGEVNAARQDRLDGALRRWEQLAVGLRARGVSPEAISAHSLDLAGKHARGDIRVLDETLALIEHGDSEGDRTRVDGTRANAHQEFRAFLAVAQPVLQKPWGELRRLLEKAQLAIPGRSYPTGTKLGPIRAALDSWFTLKRETAEASDATLASRVRSLLLFLGFVGAGPDDQVLERKRPGVRQLVGKYEASGSPVPQFGSQAAGGLRIACVWEKHGTDMLSSVFAEMAVSGRPIIMLYFGTLTEAQRVRLRLIGRDRSVVVLDEALLLFLAGEPDARLRAFFACVLPYSSLIPYTPHQPGEVPPEMYFGRQELVRELQRREGSCIVYGGRQLGKSALLREVARQFHQPSLQQYAVVIDVVSIGDSTRGREGAAVWPLLRDRLREVGAFETKRQTPDEIVKALRETFAKQPELRMLVLLDEADQLLDADARDGFAIINELRRLMSETARRFKVVLAGLHNVQRFQQLPNQPLAHFGRAIQVGPLEPRAAADLVRQPLAWLGFEFENDDDVLRILSYTNYHPGLLQLYCHELLRQLLTAAPATPPVLVRREAVDRVYQRAEIRKGIRDRFDWTLALDARYQAIAWGIIVEHAGNPYRAEPFTVRALQALARSWWPAGFATTRDDEFRGLLDEMCGLGVLVGGVEHGFRLRSPNVVHLMGDVESRLLDLGQRPAIGVFDTEHLHRESEAFAYSPLTLTQERQLLAKRWGVALVFGSRALGLDALVPSLEALQRDEGAGAVRVEHVPVTIAARGLTEWIQSQPPLVSGTRVFVAAAPRAPEEALLLVEAARKYAAQREHKSINVIGRFVFVFDAVATEAWLLHPEHEATEVATDAVLWLHKWSPVGIRARLERHQLLGGVEQTAEVLRATSGWGMLVEWTFRGRNVIPQPSHDAKIAELVLQLAKEDSTERHGFLDGLGLRPAGASRELLRQLYLLGADGISRADLTADLFDGEIAALAPDAFERHLRHLQRIGVLDIRHDPDESTAGSSRATIVVDNLAASALFG